ncbi:carbon-monoxide dehydrogenase small subunit [Anaerosolibacter carboniphilus]|uniref:Carbon-monoxide dehydrogenase small subunit n=1 Tax=Anaerosolibacter carboniphilus TaxID=1417629 RepID=A0A841KT55_9FIRM|nr:(2Fe-2S)-binding protein [Anaerosolibacter carboniphilus]MBB6216894.1 carbon-monoxide dehydrogenase small subunit [Anaerosolibacter carboniphilus]
MKHEISFTLNGEVVNASIEPFLTLLDMLREVFDLTGAKEGCGGGECGACTVLVNKKPVNACLMLGVEADGKEILTVEGLSDGIELDELQQSFIDRAALQCGYCTPGMIMSAKALLMENPTPNEKEVIKAISGNLCRCTGYKKIVEAVMDISEKNAR